MAYALREEPIDTARRHVLQAERLVAHQLALIERLQSRGYVDLAAQADAVLDTLTTSLTLARDDLRAIEAMHRGRCV